MQKGLYVIAAYMDSHVTQLVQSRSWQLGMVDHKNNLNF